MDEANPEELKRAETLKKALLNKILSKQALERLNRIRLVKPEMALQLELYLIQLYQSNKIPGEISDNQLKGILNALTTREQFKIIK